MTKLSRVTVEGFKGEKRVVEVIFSDHSASVIYGDNGCGKTTFLKLLYAVLNQNEEILSSEKIEKVSVEYIHDGVKDRIEISLEEDTYNWAEFIASPLSSTKSMSLGVERGVTSHFRVDPRDVERHFRHPRFRHILSTPTDCRFMADYVSSYIKSRQSERPSGIKGNSSFAEDHIFLQSIKIENINEMLMERYRLARRVTAEKIQSALFDTLSVAVSLDEKEMPKDEVFPDNFEDLLAENRLRIIEALQYGTDNYFKTKLLHILEQSNLKENREKILRHNILSHLFLNIIQELETEKKSLRSLNHLMDAFNEFLAFGKKLTITEEDIYIKVGENTHSIDALSSGEKHMLTFLALVMIQGGERDFIFIDEPEISLNIKWQRILLSTLIQLVPDTQIIVASHSPAIAKRSPSSLCELRIIQEVVG